MTSGAAMKEVKGAHFEDTADPRVEQQLGVIGHHDSSDKASTGYANSEAGHAHSAEAKCLSRKLTRKLDLVLVPMTCLLYLSAYLDRGNLGNARLQGLQEQALDGSDTKYSIALAMFYVTYITFSVPGTLLAKKYQPSTSIAIGAAIWAIAATAQAGVSNPAGVYVCRLFIGIGESLYGDASVLYLSIWYTRNQMAKRIAFFIGAGAVAGAFGGLLSYGVNSISHPAIDLWRILFLIEGVPSLFLALIVYFFMPSRPESSKFLTEDERVILHTRLNADSLAEPHNGIDWAAARHAALDWRIYAICIIFSCINLQLGSVSGFLPTIIKALGHTNAEAQLFTVPPYAVALVTMMTFAWFSDRFMTRALPIAGVFLTGLVGWVILYTVQTNYAARYFGCICVVVSAYSALPIIVAWQSGNNPSQSQRAVALGMLNCVGQCFAILAAFIFPSTEAPRYTRGTSLNMAFCAVGFLLSLFMMFVFRAQNAKRDRDITDRPPAIGPLDVIKQYDKAPGFRYTY